uniref:Uncharacterized protein n=1 Tax=Pararge aegeria TaxID=116150 RepID=S4P1G2_9NEOP
MLLAFNGYYHFRDDNRGHGLNCSSKRRAADSLDETNPNPASKWRLRIAETAYTPTAIILEVASAAFAGR